MTRPWKPWLDWRREREALIEPLKCGGGVVRVQASTDGPLLEFGNALRSLLDVGGWTRPWRTIQFDPVNPNTRYFGEMTRQIERSLSIPPDVMPPVVLGGGSKVGTDLTAEIISVSNSFNFGTNEYEQAVVHEQRAKRIIQTIKERVASESFCFLFVSSEDFPREALAGFLDLLWLDALADMAASGVLLVDLTRSNRRTDIEWPPSPAVNLSLADQYDEHTRECAIADLADYLLLRGLEKTRAEALAYSRAMLDHHNDAKSLYSKMGAIEASRAFSPTT